MPGRALDRRTFSALALAAAFGSRRAFADPSTGSRLPSEDDIYQPPTTLALVADLYSRMTAPLKVDDHGPFPFVVDTGANQSVISSELAARLSLPRDAPSLLNGVAGVEMAPTTVAQLGLGRRTRRKTPLFVLPRAAIGGDGMLGLDGLEGQRLVLDFKRRTLEIDTGPRRGLESRTVVMHARRRDGQLTLVDADLDGIAITAFIDSGAQSTIGNRALQRLASLREPTDLWRVAPIVSVTGQTIDGDMAELPHLRIGGLTLPRWNVAFADLHTFQLWDLTERPAILIGVDILSRFEKVTLDFAHNEVSFRLPDIGNVRQIHA
ncbi:MAG TPA: aspartyl protease family protein [Caulobacteraceae bacterium]|jgi:predicted aspartyl protease|nr:aspartyl protease family protein [Caulobacteraceae bacterium]